MINVGTWQPYEWPDEGEHFRECLMHEDHVEYREWDDRCTCEELEEENRFNELLAYFGY